ncbi:DNA-directed RNA polymerase I subunit RPA2 [Macrosteles quadrilineatus]|uniref:DNA-directed RNA polymerase I subunit RPA2 n=1 Tax=Macrosteles quadrilineatus TaxID=74068 RepID=UPI0023E09F29|nr:DNA-directed RNA polymerase I subunit RPA2 [Macrosteles quadrilineatus]
MIEKPSLKNLTSTTYGKPSPNQNEFLQSLGEPHVSSFNYMLAQGLQQAIDNLTPAQFKIGEKQVKILIKTAYILPPAVPAGTAGVRSHLIYPTECRQRGSSYTGSLHVLVDWFIDGRPQPTQDYAVGQVPIMVKSKSCYLADMKPSELINRKEHVDEWGGYFVIKGHERLIRMLLITRRNYPIAVKRSSWKARGALFSDIGILMRCVREDHTSVNNVLHFVTDGSARLMISHRKTLYYTPIMLILRCLSSASDETIYRTIMAGYEDDLYFKGSVLSMLRSLHEQNIHSQDEAKQYLGKIFRIRFMELPTWSTDEEICDFILLHCVCIHVDDYKDKFHCLVLMLQKLFSVVQDKSCIEGADAVMMQELLLGGHLYLQVLKDRLQGWLFTIRSMILKRMNASFELTKDELNLAVKKSGLVDHSLSNFLATGNVKSSSGLGLMQDKGLTIVAENINRMRYMSHFRAVHRGSFFQEMRTTEARQLLPDAWGFICPVHTPDGAPCGLLNHLTKHCQVTKPVDPDMYQRLPEVLASLGLQPLDHDLGVTPSACYVTSLDGRVVGRVPQASTARFVEKLRTLKIQGEKVPDTMEIVFVKQGGSQFPGIFLFTGPARMVRPVYNLAARQVELVGTFEQVYLDICISQKEAYPGITTHQELSKDSFLSNLACLIPMPDCNQSPRNMYQCQMGKQTMGTACHTWGVQSETKLYRLQTPATPLFRPVHYDVAGLDDFAMGTNAIVAVISYTGYDMEDAMIINKASLERGFAHGSILKSEFVDLESATSYFGLDPGKPELAKHLNNDGLPAPGTIVNNREPYYCYFNSLDASYKVGTYSGKDPIVVDNVRLCSSLPGSSDPPIRACITFRVPRNPSVGDKFASRAGQKGICSHKWPAEDLPFTESGLVPDIVFNPHGFPSRMTIAMMIECMAGKSAAVHGLVHDASPFQFTEEDTAIDYFGRLLQAGGYNYYGTERMYSGVDGREMTASIFFGVVHYQRLRHMVSDKWQVRSKGPVDVLTRQPIKGRRRGGGVRFGEMERDALISHGASFLLQDRLFNCSDKFSTLICRKCGLLLSPVVGPNDGGSKRCLICDKQGRVETVNLPYIFRYLIAQLASVNIKVQMQLETS